MNELVSTPFTTPYGSLSNTGSTSSTSRFAQSLSFTTPHHTMKYSFINKEFIEDIHDSLMVPGVGFTSTTGGNPFTMTQSSFRNLTSTPLKSSPLSLPKSLPIDWNLFNKQYKLKQKLKHIRGSRDQPIKNIFENLPFQIIDFISDCVDSQSDLVALSQTCQFFNKMVNKRLYRKILVIDDIDSRSKNFDSNYTLLDLSKNYPKLLATLHSNTEELLPLIQEIVIGTSCTAKFNQSYDQLNCNVYEALYDLFLTNDNNLKILENLDLDNLKKFGSLLKYNHDHLIKHNMNKYNYYYSGSEDLNELIKKDLLNLKNIQVLSMKDLNILPASCEVLSILIEHEFQLNDDSQIQIQPTTWSVLKNLKHLQLNTSITTEVFINLLTSSFSDDRQVPKFQNLETLSISNIHQYNDLLSFTRLNQLINLNSLKELELKFNCQERVICNSCILQFFTDWFTELGIPQNLEKVSIISMQTSSHFNFEIQWDSLLVSPHMKQFLNNVKIFFINLNDFPFVPMFVKSPLFELNDSNLKLPINNVILRRRKEMFQNLLGSLSNCECLTIVDWFYNWQVYLQIPEVNLNFNDDTGLNFMNFLNSCNCPDCDKGRDVLKSLVKQTCFRDFKNRFQTDLNYKSTSNTHTNLIHSNPDDYRILYNHIIASLKNTIPLNSQSSKISTSLKLDTLKQTNELSTQLISKEKWGAILKLFCHSMADELKSFAESLTYLKRLNLGGIQFNFKKDSNGESFISVNNLIDAD